MIIDLKLGTLYKVSPRNEGDWFYYYSVCSNGYGQLNFQFYDTFDPIQVLCLESFKDYANTKQRSAKFLSKTGKIIFIEDIEPIEIAEIK